MQYHKILHPTDYSDESRPALQAAADLAQDHGATLVLLHVVETLGPEKVTFGEVAEGPQPEAYRKRLWEEIHQARPVNFRVHLEYVLSEEKIVTAILRTAVELQCDLIVMSTHGVTGWRRLFLPSIAEEVVRKSSCPVLVVKSTPADPLPKFEGTPTHPGHLIEEEKGADLIMPGSGEGSFSTAKKSSRPLEILG